MRILIENNTIALSYFTSVSTTEIEDFKKLSERWKLSFENDRVYGTDGQLFCFIRDLANLYDLEIV